MNLSDIQLLIDYHYWSRDAIVSHAAELTLDQLNQPNTFSWNSLRRTLAHTLDSEHMWRHIFQDGVVVAPRLMEIEPFPTLESIVDYWHGEERALRAYLNGLQDSDMESLVSYEADGNVRSRVLWHCLVHMVNHGTQHFSECAQMLTDFDHSPGGIDFTYFLNRRAAGMIHPRG
jgi:uncharacterized damage-inducible protein DinB